MSKYLLEVGCEELPYKFIPSAIQQLKTGFENFLNSNKVEFEDVKVYATPDVWQLLYQAWKRKVKMK